MAKIDGNAVYPTLADILDNCAVDHGDKAAIAVMDAGAKISHAQLKVQTPMNHKITELQPFFVNK